jgi:hypothetical protein
LLVNPDVILGHVPIGEPLFEFAAAARMTDLVNFPNGFHRAIIAVATPGNGLGQANGTSFFREATGGAGRRFNLRFAGARQWNCFRDAQAEKYTGVKKSNFFLIPKVRLWERM